jgi:hypothetical protein
VHLGIDIPMALAIECDRLISDGVIKNQSELAHYAQVTTARMTHIMWLTNLAPEIQEAILFLPRARFGAGRLSFVCVSTGLEGGQMDQRDRCAADRSGDGLGFAAGGGGESGQRSSLFLAYLILHFKWDSGSYFSA